MFRRVVEECVKAIVRHELVLGCKRELILGSATEEETGDSYVWNTCPVHGAVAVVRVFWNADKKDVQIDLE